MDNLRKQADMDKGTCSVDGCDRPAHCRTLCRRHYNRDLYARDPEKVLAYNREYRKKNPERMRAADAARYARDIEKLRAQGRARYAADPERRRELNMVRAFGMDLAEYGQMLEYQGGGCAICGSEVGARGKSLAIDHNHSCCPQRGRSCGDCVRGLLCARCNVGIGMFGDDVELLQRAISYLQQPKE